MEKGDILLVHIRKRHRRMRKSVDAIAKSDIYSTSTAWNEPDSQYCFEFTFEEVEQYKPICQSFRK